MPMITRTREAIQVTFNAERYKAYILISFIEKITMKKLLLIATMLCILTSCAKEDIPMNERIPINISVDQLTKVNDQSYEDGDKIGVFVVNYNNSTPGDLSVSGNHVNNIGFTYSDTDNSWNPNETIYWKDKKTSADFYVYYPYDSELGSTDEYIFSVDSDQSENGIGTSDFLWGKASNVTPTSSAVPIVTNHVLSRIAIKIKSIEGSDENLDDIIQSVKISGVQTSAKIDLSTGKAIPYGDTKEITPFKDNDGTYKAMVIPQEVEGDSKLVTITVGNVNYVYKNEITFKENTQHNFEITVSKTGISVNVTIGPWEDVTADDNGVAEEEIDINTFDENRYILYKTNRSGGWDSNNENYESNTSTISGGSGKILEMKFKLSSTNNNNDYIYLASYGNLNKDKSREFTISATNISLWDGYKDWGETWTWEDIGASPTDLIFLKLSAIDETIIINGQTLDCEGIEDISFSKFFSGYTRESDEGVFAKQYGIPDNSELYYVKMYDENNNITYLGHAAKAINPLTSMEEYCWYSKTADGEKYEFANDSGTQGGYGGNF